MSKILTIHVIGKARRLTIAERVEAAKQTQGKVTTNLLWPIETPVYAKGEEAAAQRNRNRWDAVAQCDDILDKVATAISRGYAITLNVGPGTILTGQNTGDKETSVWANTAAPWLLREVAQSAAIVNLSAGAEDPREYDGWEPGKGVAV